MPNMSCNPNQLGEKCLLSQTGQFGVNGSHTCTVGAITAHGFPAAAARTQPEENLTGPGQGPTAWLPAVFPLNKADPGSLSIHVRAAQEHTAGHTHRPHAAKCSMSIVKQTLARLYLCLLERHGVLLLAKKTPKNQKNTCF